ARQVSARRAPEPGPQLKKHSKVLLNRRRSGGAAATTTSCYYLRKNANGTRGIVMRAEWDVNMRSGRQKFIYPSPARLPAGCRATLSLRERRGDFKSPGDCHTLSSASFESVRSPI